MPDVEVTAEQVEAWLARYGEAWEARDADAAASLFSPGSRYHETPFAEPFDGPEGVHDYWAGVTADQSDITVTSELVAVSGRTAVALWNTRLTQASSGTPVELDGVFLLEFADPDHVSVLREWWHYR